MKRDDKDEASWWVNILADPNTARIERLFPGGEWEAPERLDLEDDDIVWPQKGPRRSLRPGPKFLLDFVSLAEGNASSKAITAMRRNGDPSDYAGICCRFPTGMHFL